MADRFSALVVSALLVFGTMAMLATQSSARTILRGLFDNSWVTEDPAQQAITVDEMSNRLRVQVVRIDLHWYRAEPSAPGQYDMEYLGTLLRAVTAASEAGMQVMIDVYGVPRWASDKRYWNSPPTGFSRGYKPFYPIAAARLQDWQRTAEYLATLFRDKVHYWECWNEPNLWCTLYPQTKPDDARFSAKTYVQYLKHFFRGIRRGDRRAKVLGGVTCPFGTNSKMYLAPQRFARYLKQLGAAKWWDGYSHHPYLPATIPMPGPRTQPRFPKYNVTLANIDVLLRIFPAEPFYLTEYGYPTKRSPAWGLGWVSEPLQARYLTIAFREAAKHKQVKLLTWFLLRDLDNGDPRSRDNAFFGLRRPDGTRKPSWYAFSELK